ncbi:MAG: tetratricopeptide repeat protein [Candidatus Eisenbacteria bacterium]|uniref:Tetratricopeptide repeat protein n=1 Tax=Eiseniibacteriota bacterium TaxID=2212470 RepID=A0A956LYC1_UNCEI|nr:tetratricopeptide repeat protein [Candidatus Eisenbacteria bacterium]
MFYLVHLFLVSNLVLAIGATMGERLAYHASLGFVLLVAGGLLPGRKGIWSHGGVRWELHLLGSASAGALLAGAVVVGAVLTWKRVPDWKDDVTLFTHDVAVVPESGRVNTNAGRGFLVLADQETEPERRAELLRKAENHLEKAIAIDPEIVAAYFALGVVHDRLGEYEAMEQAWNQARARFPDHPLFATYDPLLADRLARLAADSARNGDLVKARAALERAVRYQPRQATLWFYLGTLRSDAGDRAGAVAAWREALRLDPGSEQAARALHDAEVQAGDDPGTTNRLPKNSRSND